MSAEPPKQAQFITADLMAELENAKRRAAELEHENRVLKYKLEQLATQLEQLQKSNAELDKQLESGLVEIIKQSQLIALDLEEHNDTNMAIRRAYYISKIAARRAWKPLP